MSGRRAENLLRDGESEALGSSLPSFGTGGLGGWDLVEQLHRECTVSDRCSSSQRGRQHRGFGDFFASGASAFGCASVHIEAIRALGRACHRDRDQFAILPWDGAVFAPDNLVKLYEGREFPWRQLLEFAEAFQVVRIVIVHRFSCR